MFDAEGVRQRIAGLRFGRLRYVRETDSTNDDAAEALGDSAAAGSILVAEYQRHGRGRRGRRWVAPPGSALLFTAILPEPVAAATLWVVPFWCALAVADGVEAALGVPLGLQWPNDLLLGARKLCGILSASRVMGNLAWAACGVGLNVTRPQNGDPNVAIGRSHQKDGAQRADLTIGAGPADLTIGAKPAHQKTDPEAAYLSDVVAKPSREDLLVALARAFDASFDALRNPRSVADRWSERAGLPGAHYRILIDGESAPLEARARRLGDGGELIVDAGSRDESGSRERVIALGDARVLR